MTIRPEPALMRASARGLLRAAEELEHDASTARGSLRQLEHRWVGGASLQHAGAVGDYARGLAVAAAGLREVAAQTVATAAQLDVEVADLSHLELRRAAMGSGGRVLFDVQIEQVWARIRGHQLRWVREVEQVELQHDPGRRIRCGPVRPPDLGQDLGRRMRTGPVRRIVDAWSGGSGGHQVLAVHRSAVTP